MTVQTQNRLTAAVATGIFVLLSLVLASLSERGGSEDVLRRPSTFFTDPSGARALLLVMQQFSADSAQWRRPLDLLPAPGSAQAASTLIIAGPGQPISVREADRLDAWLAAGGQLILLSDNGWPLAARAQREAESTRSEENGSASGTTLLARYAPELRWSKADRTRSGRAHVPQDLTLRWQRAFSATGGAKVVAAVNQSTLAVELPVGRGRIIAIADPTMVTNGALRRSDNAVWLVQLAAGWGNSKAFFDEYHHGFGEKRSTLELTRAFLVTPWGWSVLQLAGAGLLYLFVYKRRFGNIREPLPLHRASPLELVDARAGVFQAAAAQSLSAELIVQQLCQSIGKGHGKSADGAGLMDEIQALAKTNGRDADTLAALFGKIQLGVRLSDREFIELGRSAGEIIKGSRT